jgi:hypothetical protein
VGEVGGVGEVGPAIFSILEFLLNLVVVVFPLFYRVLELFVLKAFVHLFFMRDRD